MVDVKSCGVDWIKECFNLEKKRTKTKLGKVPGPGKDKEQSTEISLPETLIEYVPSGKSVEYNWAKTISNNSPSST